MFIAIHCHKVLWAYCDGMSAVWRDMIVKVARTVREAQSALQAELTAQAESLLHLDDPVEQAAAAERLQWVQAVELDCFEKVQALYRAYMPQLSDVKGRMRPAPRKNRHRRSTAMLDVERSSFSFAQPSQLSGASLGLLQDSCHPRSTITS